MADSTARAKIPDDRGNAVGYRDSNPSTLVNRNVFVGVRRTSLRLEPAMWDALAEICRREELNLHAVCGLIDKRRSASSLTAAIRVFILNYFRSAATEDGHANTGHGHIYGALQRDKRTVSHPPAGSLRVSGGP